MGIVWLGFIAKIHSKEMVREKESRIKKGKNSLKI